jgi:hypothetical protein
LIYSFIVLKENRQSFDPITLALRSGTGRTSLLYCIPSLLQKRRGKWRCEGIGTLTDCDTPVSHCARRFLLRDRLKSFLGFRIEKGVQHRDSSIELLLCRRTTGNGEVYLAEITAEIMSGVFVLSLQERKASEEN